MCSKPSSSNENLLSTDTNYSYIILESVPSMEMGCVHAMCRLLLQSLVSIPNSIYAKCVKVDIPQSLGTTFGGRLIVRGNLAS